METIKIFMNDKAIPYYLFYPVGILLCLMFFAFMFWTRKKEKDKQGKPMIFFDLIYAAFLPVVLFIFLSNSIITPFTKSLSYYQKRKDTPILEGNKQEMSILIEDQGIKTFPVDQVVHIIFQDYKEEVDEESSTRERFIEILLQDGTIYYLDELIYGPVYKEKIFNQIKFMYPKLKVEQMRHESISPRHREKLNR